MFGMLTFSLKKNCNSFIFSNQNKLHYMQQVFCFFFFCFFQIDSVKKSYNTTTWYFKKIVWVHFPSKQNE